MLELSLGKLRRVSPVQEVGIRCRHYRIGGVQDVIGEDRQRLGANRCRGQSLGCLKGHEGHEPISWGLRHCVFVTKPALEGSGLLEFSWCTVLGMSTPENQGVLS